MRKNSDDSLDMFKAMMISLKNIELSNSKTSPTITPTVDSSNNPQSSEVNQVPVRKGIMFASSIALETDTKRYMDELNMISRLFPPTTSMRIPLRRTGMHTWGAWLTST